MQALQVKHVICVAFSGIMSGAAALQVCHYLEE